MTVGACHPVSSVGFDIPELSADPALFVNSVLTEPAGHVESSDMANQVVTVIENQLPSDPDIASLSQMQAPIVMVHKISKGDKGKESTQLVVNGQTGLSTGDILKLQDLLPTGQIPNSGPGIYRFSVTDGESAAKCSWQTRLGAAGLDAAPSAPTSALPFNMMPTASAVRPVAAPLPIMAPSPGVRSLGNGLFYDEALELLTMADGSIHPWRKGQPLPPPAVSAAATPITQMMQPAAGPGIPFFAQPSPELEATKAALVHAQRSLEMVQQQQAQEREASARRQEIADLRTELRDSLKELAGQLTARPHEDPAVADLKRRLESQETLAALQASTKAQIDAIMALVQGNANRGIDPVITVITSMMQQGQQASQETLRMVRETAGAERQTLMTVLDRQAAMAEKAAANNPMDKLAGVFDVVVDKLGRVMQMEREFSGSGGGVDWISVIKEIGGKAGSAVEAYQLAKSREAAAAEANSRAQIAQAQASVAHDRALVAVRGSKAPVSAKPAAAPVAAPAAASAAPSPTRIKVELPNLEKATLKELRSIFNPERDEVFFGNFFTHIKQLRVALAAAPAEFSAKKIAELLMEAREFIAQEATAGRVPHAAEIWAHGQTGYLLERLLPETSEGLRSEVVKALTALQAAEADAERIEANIASDAAADEGAEEA
jgi:hypothetical protein